MSENFYSVKEKEGKKEGWDTDNIKSFGSVVTMKQLNQRIMKGY